jgi:hypothetical protein
LLSGVLLELASNTTDGQFLVFENGKFFNQKLDQFLSQNNLLLVADTNDTRGASDWTIGE